MNTMNAVPNLSQNLLLLRAMAVPSGIPSKREIAIETSPIIIEIGALSAIISITGTLGL